jgi:parvulin-like peptidyl-prolyl isomerase
MAHKYSTCVSKMTFGELGFVKRGDMPKEIEIVLFDKPIEIGKVAGPIKTKMGYHLIVVHERINFEKINIPNGL